MQIQPGLFALRAGIPHAPQSDLYGLLTDLIGNWVGNGFNLISKPGLDVEKPFVLQVNPTKEILQFDPIAGSIPNRGSVESDLTIFGLSYAQQVSDRNTNELLHVERGMWINESAAQAPPQTIARLSTIPHGDSLLANGVAGVADGPPQIDPVSVTPTDSATGKPPARFGYFPPDPEGFPQVNPFPRDPAFDIDNPNKFLTDIIAKQTIKKTIALVVSTKATAAGQQAGGILNIPFVTRNADAISMESTFWIETVQPENGSPFLQLQYTQNVILRFPDKPKGGEMIDWPHVSVGTLIKN